MGPSFPSVNQIDVIPSTIPQNNKPSTDREFSNLGGLSPAENSTSPQHDPIDSHRPLEMLPIDLGRNSGAVTEVPVWFLDLQYRTSTTTPDPMSPSATTVAPSVCQPVVLVPHPVNSNNFSISISVKNSWCMRLSLNRLCVSEEQRPCSFLPYGGPKHDFVDSRSVHPRSIRLATRDQVQFDRVCRHYNIHAAKGAFEE